MTLNDALALPKQPRRGVPWWLTLIAVAESISLAVLVVNALTTDIHPLAAALGPVHGALYLTVIILVGTLRPGVRTVLLACVPGLGGLLATGALRRSRRREGASS